MRISRDMIDRSALLLDTLIKHTEQYHCVWAVDEQNCTTVTLEEETFYVTLRERITKTLPPSLLDSKRRGSWELMLPLDWRDQIVYASSDEAQQREFMEEDRIRREALMEEEHQRSLQKRLLENMERWERAERLRLFINAVAVGARAVNEEERRQADAWAEWARAQVDSIDPVL